MGALAHVLESAGLATVCLASVLGQAQRMRAPRVLYCEFPLGRPLGKPNDPAYQHAVLRAAFDMLAMPETDAPRLDTYPEVITDGATEHLACAIPPRHDPNEHPAVSEARGLRAAFDRSPARSGVSAFGKVVDADRIPDMVQRFVGIAEGGSWTTAGIPGNPVEVAADIRAYYEEAAMALADHVPSAREAESWFYDDTATGGVMRAAQQAMRAQEAPAPLWYYLLPLSQRK